MYINSLSSSGSFPSQLTMATYMTDIIEIEWHGNELCLWNYTYCIKPVRQNQLYPSHTHISVECTRKCFKAVKEFNHDIVPCFCENWQEIMNLCLYKKILSCKTLWTILSCKNLWTILNTTVKWSNWLNAWNTSHSAASSLILYKAQLYRRCQKTSTLYMYITSAETTNEKN